MANVSSDSTTAVDVMSDVMGAVQEYLLLIGDAEKTGARHCLELVGATAPWRGPNRICLWFTAFCGVFAFQSFVQGALKTHTTTSRQSLCSNLSSLSLFERNPTQRDTRHYVYMGGWECCRR